MGIVGSPIAAAVAPLTAQAKIPLVITNAAGVSIPRISPYVVRVSFTLWHSNPPQWDALQRKIHAPLRHALWVILGGLDQAGGEQVDPEGYGYFARLRLQAKSARF